MPKKIYLCMYVYVYKVCDFYRLLTTVVSLYEFVCIRGGGFNGSNNFSVFLRF